MSVRATGVVSRVAAEAWQAVVADVVNATLELDRRGRLRVYPTHADRVFDLRRVREDISVARFRDDGARAIVFLIGGADGLDESVRKRADMILSFGALTWPHMLVRVLLAEQLYRAHTILTGHPYHRA